MKKARFGLCIVAALGALACKHQDDAFYGRVFTCNLSAAEDQCGTDRDGRAMVCYPGSQLGGDDFCAPACDPQRPPSDPRTICLTSGVLLRTCQPAGGVGNPEFACPDGLHCYRTDLFSDEGVCLKMAVCTVDKDCKDPARDRCATTIIRGLSPLLTESGSLECVKSTCQSGHSNCSDNESCLADYYYPGSGVPDICVPNCDPAGHCPPNFACGKTPRAPQSPAICLPGLPGQRCQNDQDCILGTCLDTGAGFSECTLPFSCATNADCAYLNGAATYACAESTPGASRRCVSLTSFSGANCIDEAGCPKGQICTYYSPYQPVMRHGECRVQCDAGKKCDPRGGVPHVCLGDKDTDKGCYPAVFAMPCTETSQCLTDLTCAAVSPDERTRIQSLSICTIPCASDDDCLQQPLVRNGGFCKEGFCRLRGGMDAPCDRQAQCGVNFTCSFDNHGNGTCAQ